MTLVFQWLVFNFSFFGHFFAGKSAIAVAMQLCLGSTASTTGRGKNLSSLIRDGSPGPAVIRVKLLNTGADAYRTDIYGE